jgi:hypothetical protein
MATGFPAIMCFTGSIVFFAFSVKLRKSRVLEKSSGSGAIRSSQARQKKIQIASWLGFAVGLVLLAGAIFLELRGLTS